MVYPLGLGRAASMNRKRRSVRNLVHVHVFLVAVRGIGVQLRAACRSPVPYDRFKSKLKLQPVVTANAVVSMCSVHDTEPKVSVLRFGRDLGS